MNELSREARELLASLGEADGPSAVQTSRMKRNLGLAIGAAGGSLAVGGAAGAAQATLGAGTAGAAVTAGAKLGGAAVTGVKLGGTGLGGLLSVFALGAAAGVGVSTTAAVVWKYAAPAAPAVVANAAPGAASARSVPGEPAKPLSVAGEGTPARSPTAAPFAAEPSPLSLASPVGLAAPIANAPPEPTLGPEVELVIAAKRELTLGRPAQALVVVERLAREFPNGALREERRLLEVLSLCALGEVEPARRKAREFATLSPRSPLLPRLEQSCGGEAPPHSGGGSSIGK